MDQDATCEIPRPITTFNNLLLVTPLLHPRILCGINTLYSEVGPCLDAKFFPKFHYAKRRFPITSKCRHMYGVLNVDEIKN
jgi:hypothetical protein